MTVKPTQASVFRAKQPIPQKTSKKTLRYSDVVGRGYDKMFQFHGRYICIKGSRASKKSKTTALYIIWKMIMEPEGNVLCLRNTGATLRNSCFSDLKWAVEKWGFQHLFTFRENPLQINCVPHKTCILFKGLDDPLKITSLSYDHGTLTTIWFEEAYEISDEEDFRKIDESMRGLVPPGHEKRVILTLNPWSDKHWIKRVFFDKDDPDILAFTTNYLVNEFLAPEDFKLFERMKRENPRRYRVAGLGEWGISEGVVYENWEELWFDPNEIWNRGKSKSIKPVYGLDFGYTNPTAFIAAFVDLDKRNIWIYDEFYQSHMTNREIYDKLVYKGYSKEKIIADSAEPKSVEDLKERGCTRITKARKGNDSKRWGINLVQDFHIYVHPNCKNTIVELCNYRWKKDKTGAYTDEPEKEYDHLMDALRYAVMSVKRSALYSFK